MFTKLKRQLYLKKITLLLNQGILDKKIVPFDEDFYEKMRHTYFNGIPIAMHIKYLIPLTGMPGGCYDRSCLMFFCFSDAFLCRGNNKELELRYGKENSGHGWIEIGNYVYDPSLLMKIDKDLYYSVYEISNVSKQTLVDYCSTPEKKIAYDNITKTSLQELKNPGIKRINLISSIPLIKGIAEMSNNQDFQRELNEYLELINYDEEEIFKELDSAMIKHI